MRIQHNIAALNTHRNLTFNQTNSAKNLEKLSSGYKINRAGDDAAGLAISEKMRGQIRGLDMATKNAQDGISLIQTAEGALSETHSILQRMRELAVQSSNDTNNDSDRNELQKEVDQLAQEISRIAENTEFNTKNLLGAKGFEGKFHIGANAGQEIELNISDMGAKTLGVQGTAYKATEVQGATNIEVTSKTGTALKINFKALGNDKVDTTTAAFDKATGNITVTLAQSAGAPGTINGTEADVKAALDKIAEDAGIKVSVKAGQTLGAVAIATAPAATTVNVTDIDEEASKKVGIGISTQASASNSIKTINSAIETVSAERSKLGATQNRLEHTINNLGTSSENLTAAESRIRDVDMAKEMMEFTKNNILSQAAQSMLAQANQRPQGVLQLLQ